jgi:hypothetical protein
MVRTNLIDETSMDDLNRLWLAAYRAGEASDRAVVDGTVGAEQDATTALRDFQDVARKLFPMDVAELLTGCVDNATTRKNYGY